MNVSKIENGRDMATITDDRITNAIIEAHEVRGGKVQMIDSTSVRVHSQAAAQKNSVEIIVSVAAGED